MGRQFCRKLYWYPCSSWSFWAGSGSHGLCWDLFLTHLTHTAFLWLLHLPMKMRLRALCSSKAGQGLGHTLFFSFYSLRLIRCFQPGSIFIALCAWICSLHFPCSNFKTSWPLPTRQPSKGMHFCGICTRSALGRAVGPMWLPQQKSKRLLWSAVCSPVNSQQGLLGIPSLPGAAHSEAGVICASLSGRAKVESLKNHLLSLAFKLLAKHNALPRKACLLLTWKLIY